MRTTRQRRQYGGGRAGLLLALVLLGGLGWLGLKARSGGGSGEVERRPLTFEERIQTDDRFFRLLAPCGFGRQYDGDTSDTVGILVGLLEHGQADPQRRAKAELAEMGAPALTELQRLFDDAYPDRWRKGVLQNVLAVCALMQEPAGLELIRRGLGHPQESVRLSALDGIRIHGELADYDAVRVWLPLATSGAIRADYATAMYTLDRERFCKELAGWLEEGVWPDIWTYIVPTACDPTDPETVARYKAVEPSVDYAYRPYLLAPSARDGDEEALAILRDMLVDDEPATRQIALQALDRVGLGSEAKVVLQQDSIDTLRAMAADVIARLEPTDETYELLTAGLADPGASVRTSCLFALIERGDERAVTESLRLLEGHITERELGIRALRLGWDANPGSGERTFELITRLFEESLHRSGSQQVALLQALSQIPGRATAEYLVAMGRTRHGEIRGWPVFRWAVHQSINAGPEAYAYLREQLAVESDPMRRIDLMTAIWQDRSDASRDAMEAVLLDSESHPYELLFAAQCLVKMGPATRVAPLLKRVYLGNTDAMARPSLQCLLWAWYG